MLIVKRRGKTGPKQEIYIYLDSKVALEAILNSQCLSRKAERH